MTTQVANSNLTDASLEEVSKWPWEKRWLYFESLQSVQELQQGQQPDMDLDALASGQLPSGAGQHMPSGFSQGGMSPSNFGTSKDVPPNVGKHEHVIKSQSH